MKPGFHNKARHGAL